MAVQPLIFRVGARDETQRGFNSAKRNLNSLQGSAEKARRVLSGVLAFAGVSVGINQIRQLSDEYIILANRVRLFTDSSDQAAAVQNELFNLSNRTRSSVEQTAQVYQRIAQANQTLGLSQRELLTVVENIGKAVRVSGVDAASANQALIQLGQGIASGQLRGQELNSVLEQTPRVAQQIADQLGVGIGQLRAAAIEGRVTSEVIIEAFTNVGRLDEEFAGLGITFGEAFTVVGNEALRAVGLITNFAGGASEASEAFRDLGVSIVRGLGNAGIRIFIEANAQLSNIKVLANDVVEAFNILNSTLSSGGDDQTTIDLLLTAFKELIPNVRASIQIITVWATRFVQALGEVAERALRFSTFIADALNPFDDLDVSESFAKLNEGLEGVAKTAEARTAAAKESIDLILEERDTAIAAANDIRDAQNERLKVVNEINDALLDGVAGGVGGATLPAPELNKEETERALREAAKFVKDNYQALLNGEFETLSIDRQNAFGDMLREDVDSISEMLKSETQVKSEELNKQLQILDQARQQELGIEAQALEARKALIADFISEISGIGGVPENPEGGASIVSLVPGLGGDIATRAQEELAELEAAFEERKAFLEGINTNELEVQIARDDQLLLEEKRLQEGISALQERYRAIQQRKEAQQFKQRLAQTTQFFNNLVTATRGNNETLVRLAKAAGIAEAIINTAVGVTKALSMYDFAGAAIIAAAGAAQIATIAAAGGGGGGGESSSVTAPTGGFSTDTGSPNEVDLINPSGVQSRSNVNITLEGNAYTPEQVRDLIELINEEIGDGAELRASFT